MTITPELIDRILSVVINFPGISTYNAGWMIDVDPETALDALSLLWDRHEIEKKTDYYGVVHWYDPEQPR